jgi:hypothetical protein
MAAADGGVQSPRAPALRDHPRIISASGYHIWAQPHFTTPTIQQLGPLRNHDKIKQLICEGTDVNIRNHNGATPLMLAAYHDKNITLTLLDAGAGWNIN